MTIGVLVTDNVNDAYSGRNMAQNIVPVKFFIAQDPNQILDLKSCKFALTLAVNDFLPVHSYNNNYSEISKLSSLWTAKIIESQIKSKSDLTLKASFTVKFCKEPSIENKIYSPIVCYNDIFENFSAMFKEQTFSDFMFVVKGKEFKVHRIVLAAASPYFNNRFTSKMQEDLESVCKVDNIEPDIFESILRFIYKAKLPENFSDQAMGLYEAAHLYNMSSLMEFCEQEIHSRLSLTTALELYGWAYAYIYDWIELKEEAWDIIKRLVFSI